MTSSRTAYLLLLSAALLLGTFAPSARAQSVKALVGGTLIRPAAGEVLENATVLIEGNRIAAVGPAAAVKVPEGARRIDVSGQYVLPGLIDAHVHFFQSGGLYTRPDVIDLRWRKSYEEVIADIKASLAETFRRYLASGVTSVVDMGGPMWNLKVRATADSLAKAPRVVVAGPLIASVARPKLDVGDPPILKVETPEEARRIVQQQVEAGVDLVKIWYIVGPTETPAAFRPVVEATIEAAHEAGVRVAVHATGLATARAAVEAGADILVHSVTDQRVDEAFVRLLKGKGVIYIPTLMVQERYLAVLSQQLDLLPIERRLADPQVLETLDDLSEEIPPDRLPSGIRRLIEREPPVSPSATAMHNLERLSKADVNIAAGTDAGNIGTLHGPSIHYELRLMHQAGLSPMEVLKAATLGGAKVMGRADDLGTIEEGKLADLIVVENNPLEDLAHLTDIRLVIKGGHVFRPDELLEAATVEQ